MASTSAELHVAVMSLLKANPGITTVVNSRVYDDVPASAIFPYVNLGPISILNGNADCIAADEVLVRIDCWSRSVGSQQIQLLANAVREALEDAEPNLATCALATFDYTRTDILDDPDGITKHGVVEFLSIIERP